MGTSITIRREKNNLSNCNKKKICLFAAVIDQAELYVKERHTEDGSRRNKFFGEKFMKRGRAAQETGKNGPAHTLPCAFCH
jgi:hypothetical protein